MAIRLTDLKGCGKPVIEVIPHSVVYWYKPFSRDPTTGAWLSGPRELRTMKRGAFKSRSCGSYIKGYRSKVLLCDECIVKNGLKW